MTDDLDPVLRRRLDTLAEAVPVDMDPAAPRRVVVRGRDQAFRGGSLLGIAAIVAAVVVFGAVVFSGGRTPAPSMPPTPGQASAAAIDASPSPTDLPGTSSSPAPPSSSPQMRRPPADVPLPYPDGCAAYGLSPKRCAFIANWAIEEAGADPQSATLELLGDPGCGSGTTACARTTTFVVRMRVTSPWTEPTDESVFCGVGGQSSWLCADPPQITVYDPIHGGYWDVPCGNGPGPGGCATPPPPVTSAAAKKAVPLRIDHLTVPIDHTGAYSIDLGDAVLANGILRDVSATLADDARADLSIPEPILVQVIGADGQPIQNVYEHPWRPGTEHVTVKLTFTVEAFDAPTTIELSNIVVR